jgi:hypothetical protein
MLCYVMLCYVNFVIGTILQVLLPGALRRCQTRGRRRLGGVMGLGDARCGWVVPALRWRLAPAAPYEGVSGGRLAAVGLLGRRDLQGVRAASAG